jgi:hypothetical protein
MSGAERMRLDEALVARGLAPIEGGSGNREFLIGARHE